MGTPLSTLTALKKAIKKRLRGKKTVGDRQQHPQQQQPLPPQQHDTHTGLRDAQPAVRSTPPNADPTATTPGREAEAPNSLADTTGGGTTGTGSIVTEQLAATNTPPPAATATTTGISTTARSSSGKDNTDKMATDEDYTAFLDKVNQDPNEGAATKTQSSGSGKIELKAVDKGVKVPAPLSKATKEAFYVSDADEPFVPVALKFSGKTLPDEATFAKLVNHPNPKEADVEIIDVGDWDVHGQYKEVVDATREASKGSDVRVYRIGRGGSRIEYWVVGLEGGVLVGAKALAIES